MTEIELEKQLGIEKLRVEINKMIEETTKLRAETSQINRTNVWYPLVAGSGIAVAFIGTAATLFKLLLT